MIRSQSVILQTHNTHSVNVWEPPQLSLVHHEQNNVQINIRRLETLLLSAPSVEARETTSERIPLMDKPAPGSHVPQGEPGFLGRSIDAAMEVYSWMLALTHERLWYGVDFWWVSGHRKEGLLFGKTLLL